MEKVRVEADVTIWSDGLQSRKWSMADPETGQMSSGIINAVEVVDSDMNKFEVRFDNDQATAERLVPVTWRKGSKCRIALDVIRGKFRFVGVVSGDGAPAPVKG